MYKIIFIDEQQDDIDNFKDYVDNTSSTEKFSVIGEFPTEDIEEMTSIIFSYNPDAVVVDFMLNEYKTNVKFNVSYNGVQLIQHILDIRDSFPCFVMTSFDDNAIKVSEDVNLVYIKEILHGMEKETNAKANFLERIENQIIHYRAKIEIAEKRMNELIILRNSGKANIKDETELIQIDQFLEKAIDKRNSIPEEFKSLSNLAKLSEMLNKVDKILDIVDKKNAH